MTTDPVGALRRERSELLTFCRDLCDADWQTPSAAAGWRVQDVVAHMGSGYRALFGPAALELMRSNDIERTNDVFVDQRRDWAPSRVIAEYERWSQVMVHLMGPVSRTPMARAPIRMAELGRFRVRMAVVLEWMMAVLSNQLRAARLGWLDRPVSITLSGAGGGCWVVHPDGAVAPGSPDGTAAQIAGPAIEFPEWGTQRASWRAREVTVGGDADYGARFLDAVNVV